MTPANPKIKAWNAAGPACPVVAYCEGVRSGAIVASKWIRFAVERHILDIETGRARGLWWDQEAAEHALSFFKLLRHSKGRWNDNRFELSPWQAFITGMIFGWKRRDGTRRFRRAFVDVPRKNGKTTYAAAIALYLLLCDGEAGAEIYAAATKRDQAKLVFEDAKALIAKSPDLAEHVERYRYAIMIPETRSKFEPLGADSDTLDGLNPFVAVCDEIHAWKSRDLWDVLETGMGAREQPLMFAITTAGSFEDSIYNTLRVSAEAMLEAVGQPKGLRDDGTFAFIACMDPEDDWLDSTKWAKANPNIGVSVQHDELRETIERAKNQPAMINITKRNRLGIRTNALNAWLRLDLWDRATANYELESLRGLPCYGGLDLSSTQDLAAFVLVFPVGGTAEKPVFRTRVWCWCPGEADSKSAEELRRRLFVWAPEFIEFTSGSSVDIATIEDTIKRAQTEYDIKAVCFDPWQCEATAQRLVVGGLQMVKFPQNCATYNEPARAFERAVIDGRFEHGGNPLLRWMAGNCVIAENGAGMIMPSKRKSRDKVDAIVATVMAVGCHLKMGEKDDTSIYETQGFDT